MLPRREKQGVRFKSNDENSAEGTQQPRKIFAKSSNLQGVAKKLTFDDQDTLTFQPPKISGDIVTPSLTDLLREFYTYLANIRKSGGLGESPSGDSSVVSKSKLSLNVSPLVAQPQVMLPKKRSVLRVREPERPSFDIQDLTEEGPKAMEDDTDADFLKILKGHRQIDLDLTGDTDMDIIPEPTVKSKFAAAPPQNPPQKKRALQPIVSLPKRRNKVTFGESTAEINTAFMERAIAGVPQMNLNSEDDDVETKASFDPKFDNEHSAILSTEAVQPFAALLSYPSLFIRSPEMRLDSILPKKLISALTLYFARENDMMMSKATRISERYNKKQPGVELTALQSFADLQSAEATAMLFDIILKELAPLGNMGETIAALERAVGEVVPSGSMEDLDKLIEQLKKVPQKSSTGNQNYVSLRRFLPFTVTKLMTKRSPSVTALIGPTKVTLREVSGTVLHSTIAADQRYKRFMMERLDLMKRVPEVSFMDQTLSFLVSSEKQRVRFAVFLKVPTYYPWCQCKISFVRVDFGASQAEVRETLEAIAADIPTGAGWLTKFVDAILDRYEVSV